MADDEGGGRTPVSDGQAALAAAAQIVDEGELGEARVALAVVLRSGRLERGDTVRAHRLAGEVAAAQGDATGAERHFQRMLLLDPAARPRRDFAAGVWPALERAANGLRGRGRMRITVKPINGGGVAVRVNSDPLRMVAAAWARYVGTDDAEHEVIVPSSGGVVLHLPGRRLQSPVAVGVTDEFGNRLAETVLAPMAAEATFGVGRDDIAEQISGRGGPAAADATDDDDAATIDDADAGADDPAIAPEPLAEPAGVTAASTASVRPIYARWYAWAGLAVVAGAGATYFGMGTLDTQEQLDAVVANSVEHSYTEVRALEDRGRRDALLANVCLGAAAAFTVAAAATYFLADDDGAPERPRVAPVIGPGVVGVNLAAGF